MISPAIVFDWKYLNALVETKYTWKINLFLNFEFQQPMRVNLLVNIDLAKMRMELLKGLCQESIQNNNWNWI